MAINITVKNKQAALVGAPVIVCGNSGYTVNFNFDAEWNDASVKTARFVYVQDGAVKYEDVVFTGNTVSVPVLLNVREVHVGVFAGELRTTTPAKIPCDGSIRCGTAAPADPTPSQYDQIIALLNTSLAGVYSKNVFTDSAVENSVAAYPTQGGIYRTVGVNIFKNLPLAGDQLYGVLVIFWCGYAMHMYMDTYGNLFCGRSGDSFEEPARWSSVAKSQLLWRNASPGSGFGAQTIPLDLAKVSNIMVTSIYGTIIVTKNQLGVMNFHDPTDIYTRTIEASDNGVTIGDCIRNGSDVANGIMIPQSIYSWG